MTPKQMDALVARLACKAARADNNPATTTPATPTSTVPDLGACGESVFGGRWCVDVTSIDYNWQNDMLCTRPDGSRFYTDYAGADSFLSSQ